MLSTGTVSRCEATMHGLGGAGRAHLPDHAAALPGADQHAVDSQPRELLVHVLGVPLLAHPPGIDVGAPHRIDGWNGDVVSEMADRGRERHACRLRLACCAAKPPAARAAAARPGPHGRPQRPGRIAGAVGCDAKSRPGSRRAGTAPPEPSGLGPSLLGLAPPRTSHPRNGRAPPKRHPPRPPPSGCCGRGRPRTPHLVSIGDA